MDKSFASREARTKVSHNVEVQLLHPTQELSDVFMRTEESTNSIVYLPRAEIHTQTSPQPEVVQSNIVRNHFGKKLDQNNYQQLQQIYFDLEGIGNMDYESSKSQQKWYKAQASHFQRKMINNKQIHDLQIKKIKDQAL